MMEYIGYSTNESICMQISKISGVPLVGAYLDRLTGEQTFSFKCGDKVLEVYANMYTEVNYIKVLTSLKQETTNDNRM